MLFRAPISRSFLDVGSSLPQTHWSPGSCLAGDWRILARFTCIKAGQERDGYLRMPLPFHYQLTKHGVVTFHPTIPGVVNVSFTQGVQQNVDGAAVDQQVTSIVCEVMGGGLRREVNMRWPSLKTILEEMPAATGFGIAYREGAEGGTRRIHEVTFTYNPSFELGGIKNVKTIAFKMDRVRSTDLHSARTGPAHR
jgi:hypothetical protein